MSELDVVAVPGYQGMWARRAVVEAWIAAGKPKLLWAGRTYEEQKRLYLGWLNKKPGYNAADNPDANTRQPHVRGMALDLAVWDAATVKRMMRAGFTRPVWLKNGYSQDEPWHFELTAYVGKIRDIPKVTAALASGGAKPFEPKPPVKTPPTNPEPEEEEEDDMPKNSGVYYDRKNSDGTTSLIYLIFNTGSGWYHEFSAGPNKGGMGGEYVNPIAGALETPSWAKVTAAHAGVIKAGLDRVLNPTIKGSLSVDLDQS